MIISFAEVLLELLECVVQSKGQMLALLWLLKRGLTGPYGAMALGRLQTSRKVRATSLKMY